MTELAPRPEIDKTERHELIDELDRRSFTLTEEASDYRHTLTNEFQVSLDLPSGDILEASRYMEHGKDFDMSVDQEPGRRSTRFTLPNGDQISLWDTGKGEDKESQVYFIPAIKPERIATELEAMKRVSGFGKAVRAVVDYWGGLAAEKRAQKLEARQLEYLMQSEVARFATDDEISALNSMLSSVS